MPPGFRRVLQLAATVGLGTPDGASGDVVNELEVEAVVSICDVVDRPRDAVEFVFHVVLAVAIGVEGRNLDPFGCAPLYVSDWRSVGLQVCVEITAKTAIHVWVFSPGEIPAVLDCRAKAATFIEFGIVGHRGVSVDGVATHGVSDDATKVSVVGDSIFFKAVRRNVLVVVVASTGMTTAVVKFADQVGVSGERVNPALLRRVEDHHAVIATAIGPRPVVCDVFS